MPNWGVFIWWKWWIYFCLISTFKGFFGFTLVCMLLCIFHSFYDLFNQNLFSAFQTVFQRMNPERGSKAQMKGMRQLHILRRMLKCLFELKSFENPWKIWNRKNQNGTLWDAFSWFFTIANVSQHLYEGTERVQSHAHGPLTLTFILAFPLTSTLFIMYLHHFLCREQKCSKWSLKLPVLCSYKTSVSEQE